MPLLQEVCPGPEYEEMDGDKHKVMRPPTLDGSRLELRKRLASGFVLLSTNFFS